MKGGDLLFTEQLANINSRELEINATIESLSNQLKQAKREKNIVSKAKNQIAKLQTEFNSSDECETSTTIVFE